MCLRVMFMYPCRRITSFFFFLCSSLYGWFRYWPRTLVVFSSKAATKKKIMFSDKSFKEYNTCGNTVDEIVTNLKWNEFYVLDVLLKILFLHLMFFVPPYTNTTCAMFGSNNNTSFAHKKISKFLKD